VGFRPVLSGFKRGNCRRNRQRVFLPISPSKRSSAPRKACPWKGSEGSFQKLSSVYYKKSLIIRNMGPASASGSCAEIPLLPRLRCSSVTERSEWLARAYLSAFTCKETPKTRTKSSWDCTIPRARLSTCDVSIAVILERKDALSNRMKQISSTVVVTITVLKLLAAGTKATATTTSKSKIVVIRNLTNLWTRSWSLSNGHAQIANLQTLEKGQHYA
jgi:hypothetical protein